MVQHYSKRSADECARRTVMGHIHQTKPTVSRAKMTMFLLGATLATLITLGLFTRPAQAEILNPVTPPPSTVAGCLLNIGVCPAPLPDPNPPTPIDPPVKDPNPTPSNDTTMPAVELYDPTPMLAGGTTQTVTITGLVSDKNLSRYSLAVNGNVIQQGSDLIDRTVTLSAVWNVVTPNKIPSGIYLITLDATDEAGNTTRTEKTVEVDNDGPAVTITGGDIIIKSGSISPTTVASDPHGIATYSWTADATNLTVLDDFDSAVAQPTFTPIKEGLYTFYVDVGDGLGNVTREQFNFTYAQELRLIPLPIVQDPTVALLDQTPSTPSFAPATSRLAAASKQDETNTSNNSAVLGSSITATDQTPASTLAVATIAPTTNGWSIFGILWYWWLLILATLAAITSIISAAIRRRTENQA